MFYIASAEQGQSTGFIHFIYFHELSRYRACYLLIYELNESRASVSS